jgi:galactose mutarotase-like enzyme
MMPLELGNEKFQLRIRPDLGGKIEQLISATSGRDWLWHNPHLDQHWPAYTESYIEQLDCGGWDEIFPSVSPCAVQIAQQSVRVPDHGDLVRLCWNVDEVNDGYVHMSVGGRCWPFRFERRISFDQDGCDLDYAVYNQSVNSFPYLWCAHPLLAIEAGMRVTWRDAGEAEIGTMTIPVPGAADFVPLAEKRFVKDGVASVSVTTRDGVESLQLSYDPKQLPVLGLWINYLGWSGCGSDPYFNLGIEPATAAFDSLDLAIEAGQHRILEPGECARWQLHVSVN